MNTNKHPKEMRVLRPQKGMVPRILRDEVAKILATVASTIEHGEGDISQNSLNLIWLEEALISHLQTSGMPASHLVMGSEAVKHIALDTSILNFIDGVTISLTEVSAGYLGKILGLSMLTDTSKKGSQIIPENLVWLGYPMRPEHGIWFMLNL